MPLRSPPAAAAAPNSAWSSRTSSRRAAILSPRSSDRQSARAPDQLHLIPERGGAEGAAGFGTSPAAGGAGPGPALRAEGGGAVPEMVAAGRGLLRSSPRKMAVPAQPPRAVGRLRPPLPIARPVRGGAAPGGPGSHPAVARGGARGWALPVGSVLFAVTCSPVQLSSAAGAAPLQWPRSVPSAPWSGPGLFRVRVTPAAS